MKLIVEKPFDHESYEKKEIGGSLYITGPFMGAEEVNKNSRSYSLNCMVEAVNIYRDNFIAGGHQMGELNHPESPDINPERATHLVTELNQQGNVFYGKAKILSTPMGHIVKCLMNDGVTLGVSSRALGEWSDVVVNGRTVHRVNNMILRAIDIVSDPSFSKAYVNGIMESCEFVLNETNGLYEPVYDNFKKSVKKMPIKTKIKEDHLIKVFDEFMKSLGRINNGNK